MKRCISIIAVCILAFALFSCEGVSEVSEPDNSLDSGEKSRAWHFYNGLDTEKMFITFETTTEDGTEAKFAQAINGENVTTVIHYINNEEANDLYELFTPELTYQLDIAGKKYSAANEKGTGNLFADMNKAVYERANDVSDKELDGVTYITESFGTENDTTVFYFYSETEELFAIESIKNGESIQIMRNIKVTSIIPNDVVLELPDDFTATTVTINADIEWPAGW